MRTISALLALSLPLAACRAEPEPPPANLTPACAEKAFEGATFLLCDPKGGANLRYLAAAGDQAPARGFTETRIPADQVAFAMNGAMFDEAGRPIGLAIADHREVHAINKRTRGFGNFHLMPNGVFLVRDDGSAAVVTSDNYVAANDVRIAMQSGPMLMIGGQLHPQVEPDGPSQNIRNAVGATPSGKPLFAISVDRVSLGKMARFMRDVAGTPDALYLDGSVSSLWDPAAGRQDSFVPLGPIVVAMKHAPARKGRR